MEFPPLAGLKPLWLDRSCLRLPCSRHSPRYWAFLPLETAARSCFNDHCCVLRCRMLNGILVYWTAFFFYKILICFLWLVVCILSLVTAHCRHGWLGRQYHLRLPVSKTRGSTWTYQKERKNLLPYPRFTVSILNTCAFLYCHPDSQPCMGTRLLGCHLRTLSQANSWRINPSQIFNLLDSYLLQSGYYAN